MISQRSSLSPERWPAEAFSARRCFIFVASLAAAVAIGIVGSKLATQILGLPMPRDTLTAGVILFQVVIYALVLATAVLLMPFVARRSLHDVGLRRPRFTDVRSGIIGAVAMYVIVDVTAIVQRVAFHIEGTQEAVALFTTSHDRVLITCFAIFAVVIAPIVEETVFRGFIFNALLRYMPVAGAAAASGLLFGFVHGERSALLPLSCGGVVLACVYYRTGSLAASMVTHATFNALNVVLVLATGGKG